MNTRGRTMEQDHIVRSRRVFLAAVATVALVIFVVSIYTMISVD